MGHCCGAHSGLVKSETDSIHSTLKQQRKKFIKHTKPSLSDSVPHQDTTECDSLKRIAIVLNKYHKWLHKNDLFFNKKKTVYEMQNEVINYNKYYDEIKRLIAVHYHSNKLFLMDIAHIQHVHSDEYYTDIRHCGIYNMDEQNRKCYDDNCFSMEHYFLRYKPYDRAPDPLQLLTRMHCYVFHAVYISEFQIQHVNSRTRYAVCNYIESQQRKYNFECYQHKDGAQQSDNFIPIKIVHLCSLYFAGKFSECLKEYDYTNGGINVDEQQQQIILKKYQMCGEKNDI
eukprot:237345_1